MRLALLVLVVPADPHTSSRSFTWTVSTDKLRVYALQTIFDDVTLSKDIGFRAFDGLPGVTITRPDFPRDSENGIALVTDTAIPSLSNLGVQLGRATFTASFQGETGASAVPSPPRACLAR